MIRVDQYPKQAKKWLGQSTQYLKTKFIETSKTADPFWSTASTLVPTRTKQIQKLQINLVKLRNTKQEVDLTEFSSQKNNYYKTILKTWTEARYSYNHP